MESAEYRRRTGMILFPIGMDDDRGENWVLTIMICFEQEAWVSVSGRLATCSGS